MTLHPKEKKPAGRAVLRRLKKQHDKGRLMARERIDRLLDPGNFTELGMLATSDIPGMEDKTHGDGILVGFGTVNGQRIGTAASDFTVLAAILARGHGKKMHDFKELVNTYSLPSVFLGNGGDRSTLNMSLAHRDSRYYRRSWQSVRT
jgi:acetyl-CoA carboxylase carboxyltransferase component